MPHMSNAAFGHEASRKMPRKPLRSVKAMVHTWTRQRRQGREGLNGQGQGGTVAAEAEGAPAGQRVR
eukprot:3204226-Pleurochrysis_carterae.AAC.1